MFLRTVLWIIVIYLSYRFIFNFLIPVIKATRQLKRQMNGFREQMEAQNSAPPPPPRQEDKSAPSGDYIEFEEVKD